MFDQAVAEFNRAVDLDRRKRTLPALKAYQRAIALFDAAKAQHENKAVHDIVERRLEQIRCRCAELRAVRRRRSPEPKSSALASGVSGSSPPREGAGSRDGPSIGDVLRHLSAPPAAGEEDVFKQSLLRQIENPGDAVTMDQIIGQDEAKQALKEAVLYPSLFGPLMPRDLAWSAVLLYGPPGTGKTMLARALANSFNAYFLSANSADILSRWLGESEKQLKCLFDTALELAPCVVFLDEVDSLCSRRADGENDTSRRLKTQFLIQMSKLDATLDTKRVLVLGATNVPWDLDEAALRRFQRRIHVTLPDSDARSALYKKLLVDSGAALLSESDLAELAKRSEGFSLNDISNICRSAKMCAYRSVYEAKHFRHLDVAGQSKYAPLPDSVKCVWNNCSCQLNGENREVDVTALPLRCHTIDRHQIAVPLLQWADVFKALTTTKRTVPSELVERYNKWG